MEWESDLEVLYGRDKQLETGEPFDTYIVSRDTYERKYVRAVIKKEGSLEGGEKLWVRTFQGQILPQPWAIKILEELPTQWSDQAIGRF